MSIVPPAGRPPRHTAHLSLGGNLGDRAARLAAALPALAERGVWPLRASPLYQTAPMYVQDQPAFLNMALTVATDLSPTDLLAATQAVERAAGRARAAETRNGPRALDIDIVMFGQEVLHGPDLTLPHPRLAERAFVLVPLADIAGDAVPPGGDATIDQLLAQVAGRDQVIRHAPPPPIGGPPPTPGRDETYTILLRDFTARRGEVSTRINLDLTALHPGRRFRDDISAVMSYEDIVVGLRRLCALGGDDNAATLARRSGDLCLGFPRVLAARIAAVIARPGRPDDEAEQTVSHL